jgi:hypothetical protein
MVAVCKKHLKRIPAGHTVQIVKEDKCELCKMIEAEIKEYIKYRNKYLW